jgi:hypothetical protein
MSKYDRVHIGKTLDDRTDELSRVWIPAEEPVYSTAKFSPAIAVAVDQADSPPLELKNLGCLKVRPDLWLIVFAKHGDCKWNRVLELLQDRQRGDVACMQDKLD